MTDEETYNVLCPECGHEYDLEADLDSNTVYICTRCGSELVPGGINGLLPYWGEFWDESTGDLAQRVNLEPARRNYYGDLIRSMFTTSMEAVANLGIRREQ